MLRPIDIMINCFAQEKIDLDKLLLWFDSLSKLYQRETINWTRNFLEQSHPNEETIKTGIEQIPLKPTMTPIVLLKSKSLKIALNKIVELPDAELKKAFISLVSMFKVSDKERREKWCEGKCGHDWHNLDDLNIPLTEKYLKKIEGRIR
ncbi:MAG: hypothetical protein JST62_09530 [Bacteroidetes bacterium]|nr:hypothetical protein [Bacteroidota bacterium]